MKPDYRDLLFIGRKVGMAPKWWDETGVPRFKPFHPKYTSNPYTSFVVLAEVKCAECGEIFRVEMTLNYLTDRMQIPPVGWSYGRPPFHLNNCERGFLREVRHIKILKAYRRKKTGNGWERVKKWERTCIESMSSEELAKFRRTYRRKRGRRK